MLAAIDVNNAAGRKILVLGDMGEVGDDGDAFTRRLVHAAQCGVNVLLATGGMMRQATQAFGVGAQHFTDVTAMADVVRAHSTRANIRFIQPVCRALGMGMERVVDAPLEMNQSAGGSGQRRTGNNRTQSLKRNTHATGIGQMVLTIVTGTALFRCV